VSSGLAGLVVTTAILVLFSEAFYWYSGGVDYPARVLAYLIPGCGLLWSLSTFRVDGWAGVMLAGAIYGFVAEGVLTPQLYGAFPFDPFHLSYTSLAWHAVLSVGFGLVVLHCLLVAGRVVPILAAVAAFGVLWGLWATSYWLPENLNDLEANGARWLHGPVPVPGFLLSTTLVTIVLAVLHAASGRVLHADALRPGRLLCRLSAIAAVLWFAVLVVPQVDRPAAVVPERHRAPGAGLPGAHP
jgi:hypothetical protein